MASPEDYFHTMAMFDGPWYECQGPTKNEALELVKTHMEIRNKYFPDWVIGNCIDKSTVTGSLGSWRGFHSFTLTQIIDNCNKWHTKYSHSMEVIKKSKMRKWMNHILYRCPDKNSDEKMGLRVKQHERSFNETASN